MTSSRKPNATRKPDILVVEDDADLRELLLEELEEYGHQALGAADVETAQAMVERHLPRLVISDLRLPDGSGLELLQKAKALSPASAFIVITAFGTVDQAVEAVKRGADDFITKPLDLEHLRLAVDRVLETRRLRQEVAYYRQFVDGGDFHGMIGRSAIMRRLFQQIERTARAGGPVLITGESGAGKELVARAVHRESERRDGPFVAINCGGMPATLLESELFGHVTGAFTGAKARKGLFAAADGGTLLLDEIGEMPVEMQATLLRILEDGRVRPLGSNQEQALDVRIVAATNRKLQEAMMEGSFREDLYYRLETFTLEIPALRQREDDIEHLVMHLIGRFSERLDRRIDGITAEALRQLRGYRFPGNVRELSNVIERAVTFCQSEMITPEDLPERVLADSSRPSAQWTPQLNGELLPLEAVERAYVKHVLASVEGNKRQAAMILGIGRRTLYRWLDDDS